MEVSCLVPAELFLTRCQIRLSIATRDDLLVCPSCLYASRFEIYLRVVDCLIICSERETLVNPWLIFYCPTVLTLRQILVVVVAVVRVAAAAA